MLNSNLPAPIAKTQNFDAFSVASVLIDFENERVVAAVNVGQTRLPLVLWDGAQFDPAAALTNAMIINRTKALLPAALA